MKKIYILILFIFLPSVSMACHGNHYTNINNQDYFGIYKSSNKALKFRCGDYTNRSLARNICYSY